MNRERTLTIQLAARKHIHVCPIVERQTRKRFGIAKAID